VKQDTAKETDQQTTLKKQLATGNWQPSLLMHLLIESQLTD